MKRKISVTLIAVVLLMASFVGGMATQYHRASVITREVDSSSTQNDREVVSSGESKVIIDYPPNQCMVNFTSDKLLAPNFYIGYGDIGSAHDWSIFDKKKYNPKGVNIDKTMSLIDQIVCLDGVTGNVYAENYNLTVEIAASYLDRRGQIVKEVADIINSFEI